MQLRNNNRQIIKDLARMNGKENKIRNRILVFTIAIAFIIILLTLSMLNAGYDSYYVEEIKFTGDSSSFTLSHPTSEQKKLIENLPYVDKTLMEHNLGYAKIDGIENVRCSYMDEKSFNFRYELAYTDIKGNYPQGEDEIMLSKRTLKQLGLTNPHPGMTVNVELNDRDEFKLSGYFTDYGPELPNAFLSEKYYKSALDKYTVTENLVIFETLKSEPEVSAKKISKAAHVTKEQTITGDGNHQLYIYNGDNSYVIYLSLILMVLLCAHFLINSSLAVTLNKDIKSFALLKILGATDSQLFNIVLYQTLKVCLWGIMIGIAVGSILVIVLIPFLIESIYMPWGGTYPVFRAYNPLFIVATAALVFAMATISSFTGLRKIANLSAPDSRRKAQNTDMRKRTMLIPDLGIFTKLGIARWIKARSNYLSIAMPLLLCIFIILCFSTWISGIYGTLDSPEKMDDPDFFIHSSNLIMMGDETSVAYIDRDMEKQLLNMHGVTDSEVTYGEYVKLDIGDEAWQPYYEAYKKYFDKNMDVDGWLFQSGVEVVDEQEIEQLEKYVESNDINIDVDAFRKGKGVISRNQGSLKGKLKDKGESVSGSSISISTRDDSKIEKYEFLGYIKKTAKGLPDFNGIIVSHAMPTIIISEKGLERLGIEKQVQQMDLYVNQMLEPWIERRLTELIDKKNIEISIANGDAPDERGYYISMYAMSDMKTIWHKMDSGMRIIAWGLTLSILILTILQYSSVLITNSISRAKELNMLNSLGMTQKQIETMLAREGLIFGLATSLLLLTAGSGLVWLFGQVGMLYRSYFTFEFPMKEILFAAVVLIALSLILPIVVFKFGNRRRKSLFR